MKNPPCTCTAYQWPHRPGGGLCRHPLPPLERCSTPAGTNRPQKLRRRGYNKQIMRREKLHPIRDRVKIETYLPRLKADMTLRLEHLLAPERSQFTAISGVCADWVPGKPEYRVDGITMRGEEVTAYVTATSAGAAQAWAEKRRWRRISVGPVEPAP